MTNRLNYLKDIRGIGVFTAHPGMGKSYALRCFAASLNPSLYHMEYLWSWPYFKSTWKCSSNKATTLCGVIAERLRSPTALHRQVGIIAEFKLRFASPVICRRTV